MNILVLGANGYLGKNIVHELLEKEHDVFCVMRDLSYKQEVESLGACALSSDLGDIERLFERIEIDYIINSACAYKVNDSLYGDLLEANVFFPLRVLNKAIQYNIRNYITIGSSLPNGLNFYSFSKNKFSEFAEYMCEGNAFNFADLRLEMFYGGLCEPPNRFLRSCREKLKLDEDILLTEGGQKRDIIHVEDVVSIISRLIETGYVRGYSKLSVGSGENHSIREIIEFMKDYLDSTSNLKFGAIESRKDEPDTLANIEWYKEIGYNLKYTYFEGLKVECLSDGF